MLKNYIKIAFRNLLRHKAYSLINIAGLAIGMASSILILLWVQHELSYDRFNKNSARLYRIICNAGEFRAAVNPAGMPAGLRASMPEIETTVRFSHPYTQVFEIGERKFEETRIHYVDSNFLQVFDYPLLRGDTKTALGRLDGIVITQEMARKYFGNEDPMGKTITKYGNKLVTVTGILKNIPANSHLQFDFLMPLSSIVSTEQDLRDNVWDNFNYYSYVLLKENFRPSKTSLARLDTQMVRIYKQHVDERELKVDFQLQPLVDIHLHPGLQVDISGHGNKQYVKIFFIVAIFILVVACINFMNLATARSARRAKEVGLRKTVGALRGQLIRQFLGEAVFLSILALLFAIAIVLLLLPAFNQLAGKSLNIHFLNPGMIAGLLGIAIFAGLLSGSYPALFLSGFRPARVLKGKLRGMGGSLLFRNTLVVTQFVVSIVLLAGTVVVYRQLRFIKNKDLGFDKENLVYLRMAGDMWDKYSTMRAELKQNPLTANFGVVNELPTNLGTGTIAVEWPGKDPHLQIVFPNMDVDEGFVDAFKMKIIQGRNFSSSFLADSNNYIINEKAAAIMNFKPAEAIGKPLKFGGTAGTIVGVIRNFNYKPIQQEIEPMVLRFNRWGGTVVIRTQPGKTDATIKAMERISHELNPAYPFSYDFLDQDIANLYKSEQRLGKLFNLFAILGIFISCLGLYGLSAFMAEQRVREIGVRKVMGASVFNIVYLLSRGFTRLILIAMALAIPLSWWAINSWLRGFAYHVEVGWFIFLAASLIALLIAWVTVSYESIKAAIANPVKSLRTE